jgi:hypothetical protein
MGANELAIPLALYDVEVRLEGPRGQRREEPFSVGAVYEENILGLTSLDDWRGRLEARH